MFTSSLFISAHYTEQGKERKETLFKCLVILAQEH